MKEQDKEVIIVDKGTISIDNTINVTCDGGTIAQVTDIPSTLEVNIIAQLPTGTNTIGVVDRVWTITETIPVQIEGGTITDITGTVEISSTDLDIRDIIETIPVWEQGKITYSTIPINSITFDYVGGTLSTINFYNIDSTIEFSLLFNYSGDTLTSIVRS